MLRVCPASPIMKMTEKLLLLILPWLDMHRFVCFCLVSSYLTNIGVKSLRSIILSSARKCKFLTIKCLWHRTFYIISITIDKCQHICRQLHSSSFVGTIEVIVNNGEPIFWEMITDLMCSSCKNFYIKNYFVFIVFLYAHNFCYSHFSYAMWHFGDHQCRDIMWIVINTI